MTRRTARIQRVLAPGFLALAALIAGCRGGAGPEWSAPPPVVEGPPFVEIVRLEGPAPVDGDLAAGGAGDWLLRNERLAVVVSGPGNPGSPAGVILDAAPARGRDRLIEAAPADRVRAGPSPVPVAYERVFHDADADSAGRTLVLSGRAGDLEVTTRITLRAGVNALRLSTTLTNRGDRPVPTAGPEDRVQWAGESPFLPGAASAAPAGEVLVPFVGSAGDSSAYAWVDPDTLLVAAEGGRRLAPAGPAVRLFPGQSVVHERVLVVCAGSWAEAADLAWTLRKEPFGRVVVGAVDPRRAPVEGAVIEARDGSGRLWAKGASPALGVTALPLPPGRYDLTAAHPHRRQRGGERIEVAAGEADRATLRLTDPGRLRLAAADERGQALAARWSARDLEGGPDEFQDGAAPPPREFVIGPGGGDVLLPPGRWRLRADHGPAHESWTGDVEVEAGRSPGVSARLESLPVPGGWLVVDLSAVGGGSAPVDEARRQRLAADGVAAAFDPQGARPESAPPLILSPDHLDPERAGLVALDLAGDPRLFRSDWDRWLERLGAGEQVVAVADRSFVDLRGGRLDEETIAAALKAGRVQGTRGPFIELELNGEGLGSTVDAEPGPVRGRVSVIAPSSVDVREILIYVNEEVHAVFRLRGRDPIRFDEDFELYVTEPGAVIARVDGVPAADPVRPAAGSAPPGAESGGGAQALRPLAFTNPIRVAISGRQR